ncbi:hypothetical protein L6R49_14940 [Myxococcota bacterium]|nr:hypothetical protein [Myxococcota bacterium]
MKPADRAQRMEDRLPLVLQGGANTRRLLLALAEELAREERGNQLLLMSRWFELAQGWVAKDVRAARPASAPREAQDAAERAMTAGRELGRLVALLGLRPDVGESARELRERAAAFVSIHREGLGTARAIFKLAALVYRAKWPPTFAWEQGVAVSILEVRGAGGKPKQLRLELRESPAEVVEHSFTGVQHGMVLLTSHDGLPPLPAGHQAVVAEQAVERPRPELHLTARGGPVAFPCVTHVESGEVLLFLGEIPEGETLTLRHDRPPRLNGAVVPDGDTRLLSAQDPPRFNHIKATFRGATGLGARFTVLDYGRSIPELQPGVNRFMVSFLTEDQVVGLASSDVATPSVSPTPPGASVDLRLRWRASAPATFTLRVPADHLPERFVTLDGLADELTQAIEYGRAAGVRGRLELAAPTQRDVVVLSDRLALDATLSPREAVNVDDGRLGLDAALSLVESELSPEERFATPARFDEHRFNHGLFTTTPIGPGVFDSTRFGTSTFTDGVGVFGAARFGFGRFAASAS